MRKASLRSQQHRHPDTSRQERACRCREREGEAYPEGEMGDRRRQRDTEFPKEQQPVHRNEEEGL